MNPVQLSTRAKDTLRAGGVFVPSPLALTADKELLEPYQRLLTLYYIRAGAAAVIPGAHTGEFAGGSLVVLDYWLRLVREMTLEYGHNKMILMAAVGGPEATQQAELAARHTYDLVMVAPTAYAGKSHREVVTLFRTISSIIPTFAFELQRAIPGSYPFTERLWLDLFEVAQGAKGASFDTYQSLVMLEAAAKSVRSSDLVLFTGNDDRIVADLFGSYTFQTARGEVTVQYSGGLLGHFATDTRAAVNLVKSILQKRYGGAWALNMSKQEAAHAVNRCNMVLFDALGNFENSVWGVKSRLTDLGVLPGPFCLTETGRPGLDEAIRQVYGQYSELSDAAYLHETLATLKNEMGIQ